MCSTDQWIILIGKVLWKKHSFKKDKIYEGRKSVMTQMRQLAKIALDFKSFDDLPVKTKDSLQIFYKKNFRHLMRSIESICTKNGEIQPGKKISYKYLLLKSAKIIQSNFILNDFEHEANEILKFITLLNNSEENIFGDASYLLRQNKQTNLRKPQALPLEKDVEILKDYICKRIKTINQLNTWNIHNYVEMRDLVVARLTLFNARRGGEPSRLLLSEWNEAKNENWINKTMLKH